MGLDLGDNPDSSRA